MTEMEAMFFKLFLKQIRHRQNCQKKEGERVWSMDYVCINLSKMCSEMGLATGTNQAGGVYDRARFGIKRTYAIAHRLEDKGLIKFRKYGYKGTFVHLTDEGMAYVKALKQSKRPAAV